MRAWYHPRVSYDLELPALGHICDITVDHPRWSIIKRRSDGVVDFVSPFPCPYNYGSVTGWMSPDGDALDAVVLGPRLPHGARVQLAVRGVIGFLDGGVHDPKVIFSADELTESQRAGLTRFFRAYTQFKVVLRWARRKPGATRYLGWLR